MIGRRVFAALLASLALALSLGTTSAAAADGGAGALATPSKAKGKKGKAKKKSCKGKKGKAKRKCKSRGRGSGKLPLRNGTYEGQEGISLKVKSGGKRAALVFFGSSKATCLSVGLEFPDEAAKSTAASFKAGGKTVPIFGGYGSARWVIEVTPQLKYRLTLDSSLALPEQQPCDIRGVRFSGTLKKTG
jgi:hypothetical protein